MIPNNSPWIKQLNPTRPVITLKENIKTDVIIIGGGIAGMSTAYFILKETKKKVVLLEADKIAHGATGHNAGQVTSYFERPLTSIIEEFGEKLAIEGLKAIETTWSTLEEIIQSAGLQTPLYRFTGYSGLSNIKDILSALESNRHRIRGKLPANTILIAEETGIIGNLDKKYSDLYQTVKHKELLTLLETKNTDYKALISQPKGCMNSALFTEELLGFLIGTYPKRFSFFEHSPVSKVTMEKEYGKAFIQNLSVEGKQIILCTNGFENFKIENNSGKDINPKFHHLVDGRIGYMAGYIEPMRSTPITISYFPKKKESSLDPTGETYFYLTRRPHEHKSQTSHNLICAGGPEKVLPNEAVYSKQDNCHEEMQWEIDSFLQENYLHYPEQNATYHFCWHGLMGYTPNGIRRIGREPYNKNLLYNLGCNGVGILPSIYGGKRISELLKNKNQTPTIFDPVNS